jgi:hypothetical protein
MPDMSPKCPKCNATLDLKTDVAHERAAFGSGIGIMWCKKCGAVLGGSVV